MAVTDTHLELLQPSVLEILRKRYFRTIGGGTTTVISLVLLVWLAWMVLNWAVFSAVFDASGGPEACHAAEGACWSVIAARWRLILFGLYPFEAHWRSGIACTVVVLMTILTCIPKFWNLKSILIIWIGGYATFYIMMKGGIFGLEQIDEEKWGGLSLTVFIFLTTAMLGMPMSIVWALMRRSKLPWIARVSGLLIDTARSLPLLSILFAAAILLPLVLPSWAQGDKLYRVVFGMALFFSAYQAEIIRGGMQGVPTGQEEAAQALGLSYRHTITRILLPQAFKNALPATINQFVITFKETSLVIIVGFFEILASGQAAFGSSEWTFAFVEVYAFIAFIYFVFVFSLSRYGAYLERRMAVGDR